MTRYNPIAPVNPPEWRFALAEHMHRITVQSFRAHAFAAMHAAGRGPWQRGGGA